MRCLDRIEQLHKNLPCIFVVGKFLVQVPNVSDKLFDALLRTRSPLPLRYTQAVREALNSGRRTAMDCNLMIQCRHVYCST